MKTHIKELRKERNITQQEIADKLGVTKSYISYVESEKTGITLENASEIAIGEMDLRQQNKEIISSSIFNSPYFLIQRHNSSL